MGILDDLAMGFGLKARTQDYDARTARNIAETQAFGNDPHAAHRARQNYKDYGARYEAALTDTRGQAQKFLQRQGGEGYSPSIIKNDDRPLYQRALFSPQSDLMSPKQYAIGPMQLDGPLRIPGILGMITGGLFGQQNREIPTVSADGGAMRVRPSGYQPPYSTTPYEIGNSGAGMDYVTPAPSGPQYTGPKDYAGTYQHIDSPLLDFQPTTADLMESHIPLTSEPDVDLSDLDPDTARITEKMLDLYPDFLDKPESEQTSLIEAARRLGY